MSYNPHPLCLVVYYIPKGLSQVWSLTEIPSQASHFSQHFLAAEAIKQKCTGSGPKAVVSSVDLAAGGIMKPCYPGQLP